MSCERRTDAGAYALDALEPAEARDFEEHLATCRDCRDHVAQLAPVVDALPMAAPQLAAPPELKDRIMAVVESEARLLRAAGPEADRAPTAPPRRRWAIGGGLRIRPIAALATAAALLAGGVVAGTVLTSGDGTGDVRTIAARAPGPADVRLEVGDDGRAELVMTDMPAAPAGRVYQVWIARSGKPEPTHTLFTVAQDGRARVAIDEPVDDAEQVLVTAEPAGGSREPTRAPVVIATLS